MKNKLNVHIVSQWKAQAYRFRIIQKSNDTESLVGHIDVQTPTNRLCHLLSMHNLLWIYLVN